MYNVTYPKDAGTILEETLAGYKDTGNTTFLYTIKLIQNPVLWDITPRIKFKFKCCFGGTYHFRLQGGHRKQTFSKVHVLKILGP
jgi:hypothetical protein